MGLIKKTANYLEERLELITLWNKFTNRQLPSGIGWMHTFGSATLFLLLVQVITGMFLAFYYLPSPEHAYESVYQITNQLAFGELIRGIHKWGASLAVVFMLLHLLRVLFMATYKYPRELTWAIGVLLLVVVFAFGFTGYLLPWDQKAYWATVVGTHIAGYVPIVGNFLLEILRGQPEVGVRTLGRFYAAHTLFLPAILFILITIHLFMVIKQGIAPLPLKEFAAVKREEYPDLYKRFKEKGRPFYENMTKDAIVAFVLLGVLILMAVSLSAPLEQEADPTSVTYVPRPEWYFFFLFELLWWAPGKWIPVATFWIPTLLILVLLFLPWLDRSLYRHPLRRPVVTGWATAFLIIAAFLTYKGATAPKPPTLVAEVKARAEAAALPPLALAGSKVYEEQGCAACHTIDAVGGAAGPDLTKVGRHRDTEWLKVFIKDPTTMVPDSEMPAYDWLSEGELEALAAYLSQLK